MSFPWRGRINSRIAALERRVSDLHLTIEALTQIDLNTLDVEADRRLARVEAILEHPEFGASAEVKIADAVTAGVERVTNGLDVAANRALYEAQAKTASALISMVWSLNRWTHQ